MIRVILLSGVTAGETRGYCDLTPKEVSAVQIEQETWVGGQCGEGGRFERRPAFQPHPFAERPAPFRSEGNH